ncbi:MAG: hypothetical protein ABIK92_13945 [Pseudomonadota bacterium]
MQREAMSDVQLSEDLNHDVDMPQGDYMEDFAQLVIAESEDYDLCFIPNLWHVGGGKSGYWQVDKALMIQTTFMMIPKNKRGKIHNNEFIGNRLDPKDWADTDFSIKQVGDSIVWNTKKMEFISRPPYWEIKGDHMGIQYNMLFGGIGKAIRSGGLWEDLPKTLRAGYDHFCWVEGDITVGGKKHVLKNAYGLHERLTFGKTYDPVTSMRKPYNWVLGMNDKYRIYFFVLPGEEKIGQGQISINDEKLTFGLGDISVKDLELWIDPLTGMQVPCRWEFKLNSKDGKVNLEIAAGGRSIFTVTSHTGTTVRYAYSCIINGQAIFADGRKADINDVMAYMEWGKSSFPLQAGI